MMSSEVIRLRWLAGVLGSALLVSACGGGSGGDASGDESAADSTTQSDAMPVQDSAFGDMVGTMDRARSVETTEMERKEALDQAIEREAN